MRAFLREMRPTAATRILDVGGTPGNWELVGHIGARITLLNIALPDDPHAWAGRFEVVAGDGTDLPYADKAFDIVFSNSVIEHVGAIEKQKAFAGEVLRVGRRVWIQTPARSFFIEPHLLAPFIHWLPPTVCRRLVPWLSVWAWMTRPTDAQIEEFLRDINLLSYDDLRRLFPGCRIITERFLGLPKSYIVTSA